MPKRIQRKRTRGWRMPPNTVYVGRPTKWGNPFTKADGGPKQHEPHTRISAAVARQADARIIDVEECLGEPQYPATNLQNAYRQIQQRATESSPFKPSLTDQRRRKEIIKRLSELYA